MAKSETRKTSDAPAGDAKTTTPTETTTTGTGDATSKPTASQAPQKTTIKKIKADVIVSRTNIERAVSTGTRSQSVKLIQDALKVNGLYDGQIDGHAGTKTKAAMRELAETNGLDNPTDAVALLGFNLI